jgi:hypothetical protein
MKILYLSCHSVLEREEILLFHELGHEVFSPGGYWNPATGGDGMRPPLPELRYRQEWVDAYQEVLNSYPGEDGKLHLTRKLVDMFDVVVVMHIPDFIIRNWGVLLGKRVIWRTIGQSISHTEGLLRPYRRGIQVVRYSPRETGIPGFIGMDALIRFYKDPDVYTGWTGDSNFVVNFTQSMEQRGDACGWGHFLSVTDGFPRKLFGPENNQPEFGMGKVSFERQLAELRGNRAYFYTGTQPASYTLNFIEAWMVGIPVVAIGEVMGNGSHFPGHNLYEIQDLIANGESGYVSDDVGTLRARVQNLLRDKSLAAEIGGRGRQEAIRHFGKVMIGEAWRAFLG